MQKKIVVPNLILFLIILRGPKYSMNPKNPSDKTERKPRIRVTRVAAAPSGRTRPCGGAGRTPRRTRPRARHSPRRRARATSAAPSPPCTGRRCQSQQGKTFVGMGLRTGLVKMECKEGQTAKLLIKKNTRKERVSCPCGIVSGVINTHGGKKG